MTALTWEMVADPAVAAGISRAAFGRGDEAELVVRLHAAGAVVLSLLARRDGVPAGHVLFSRLALELDGRAVAAAALAPLAVHPDQQGRGIGSALVHEGLARLRRHGTAAVIVLGDPGYYSRFGFSAGAAAPLAAPFSGPAFMALELKPGALAGRHGTVVYPACFGIA